MPFPGSSDSLPTAAQRYDQLTFGESKVPHPSPALSLENLSKILDGFFPIAEKPADDVESFLIDFTGFYDIIKYSYEAVVEKGRGSSLLSCHEYALVCFWYLFRRLADIYSSLGFQRTEPSFLRALGHDLLPQPVFEYLSNLGPVILPTGKLAAPAVTELRPGGHLNRFNFQDEQHPDAPNWNARRGMPGSCQIGFLKDFIRHWRPDASKVQSYYVGEHQVRADLLKHVLHAWHFPNPARTRALDEVKHDFAMDGGFNFAWNPAILQAYRAFTTAARGNYVFSSYERIVGTKGSVAEMPLFERDIRDDLVYYVFRGPVPMSAEDVTLALLFRYRCIHSDRAAVATGGNLDACRQFAPVDLRAPFGLRMHSLGEVLSQVKDFCAYYTILGK